MTETECETLAEREMRYILEWAKNPRPATWQQLPTIPYTKLPEYGPPGGHLVRDWDYFRTEVGQLLAEGHGGCWALVVGERVIGVWDTREQAQAVGRDWFPGEPVLVQSVRERYQVSRVMGQLLIRG